ncbi:MAG TPA: dihydrolipoamide acetyltransferase family protein, partial [Terrimesophilobacter sp.]|nr:dihydrolipoamide acetyltransferase family protein [Terrimesophilobacter sp.]
MSSVKEFILPDLGEGLTESELVSWHVAVGDKVDLNQVVAEVETAKAIVQLPSPFAGVVAKLYEEAGATVQVGAPLMSFEVEDGAAPLERNPVLVGYGAPIESDARPTRRSRGGHAAAAAAPAEHAVSEPVTEPVEAPAPAEAPAASEAPVRERPRSTPPVRKLAHDLGVDLTEVTGTGDDGLITREDVRAAASSTTGEPEPERVASGERESRTPIKGVRKHTAAAMVSSAFTAPHVTEFLTIDVTPTMDLISSLKTNRAFADYRINLLTVVAKALLVAARRTPSVNTRWDEANAEIVQYHYVNLGIAAATSRGLIVPNLKDADRLSLTELSTALAELTATARTGTTTPAQLTGGTISITN